MSRMDEKDIDALVAAVVGSHGSDAAAVIARRIDDLIARGDEEWAAIWASVLERITGEKGDPAP